MPIGVRVKVRGQERYAQALRSIEPRRNPGAIRRAMIDSERILLSEIDDRLQGPRPRFLGEVTGELRRSPTSDRSGLPFSLEVGFPGRMFWIEFHEFGLGRFRKRSVVLPALEDALRVIPGRFLHHWEAAA